MKKQSELDDDKCFISIKEKEIFPFLKKKIQSNRFILQESESSIQEEAVSTIKKG